MSITKTFELVTLNNSVSCCKCGEMIPKGKTAVKYKFEKTGLLSFKKTRVWCMDCECKNMKG